MLRYDDLLAARFLNRQLPERRVELLQALDHVQQGYTQRSFLSLLMDGGLLTLEQAQYVHGQVERARRARSASVYAQFVTTQGVQGPRVRACLDQLGERADLDALGAALVAAGAVTAERERELRFKGRVLSDRDQAEQVRAYLESRAQQPEGATVGVDTSISGVVRLPTAPGANLLAADPLTPGGIRLSESTQAMLRAPRFPIPGWIDTSDPQTGKPVGAYRVLGRIGAGAMGVVYLADHPGEPERPVALKLLESSTEEARGRFKREVLANGFFSHPGVIDVYDAGTTPDGRDFLAMEFFDGEDLEQILETEKQFEPRRAVELCKQVFAVLGAAHEAGIVHRDIKPANILVSRDLETARLMDFGIALIRDLGEFEHMVFSSIEGGSTGTPQYMSPEQAAGDKVLHPSDLYSMGLVLYRTLSGRLPFDSESASGFLACHMMEEPRPLAKVSPAMKALPRELHDVLGRLFDKNPARRPASAAEVVAILERVQPQLTDRKPPAGSSGGGLLGFLWKGRS